MIKKVFILAFLGLIASFGNAYLFKSFSRKISFANIKKVPQRYTAIIFGAGLRRDSTPSSILKDRLDAGKELYLARKVQRILLSGDNRKHGYDEPESMKRYLIAQGIPAENIFLDYAGFDTYSTLYRAKAVFGVKEAILVSQQYHLDRALYLGKKLDLDVVGFSSDKRNYKKAFVYNIREIASRAKGQLDLLRRRKPYFLGKKIDIHGTSNAMVKEVK